MVYYHLGLIFIANINSDNMVLIKVIAGIGEHGNKQQASAATQKDQEASRKAAQSSSPFQ